MTRWRPWQQAWADALYGDGGFYRRPSAVRENFRTAVSSTPLFAAAILRLAAEVDDQLGRSFPDESDRASGGRPTTRRFGTPARFDVVDVGAGGGELLTGLAALGVPERWRLTGVDVGPRPDGLPGAVNWRTELPEAITGLVVAHEWLDNVPTGVVEQTESGPRIVEVAGDGTERLGPPLITDDDAWLGQWWPLAAPGERAELGRTRDDAWADVVQRLDRGLAVAIDYAATPACHRHGTLAAYRDGRAVRRVPDGSRDLTAHVLFTSCAAAGERAGASGTALLDQASALAALGVRAEPPPACSAVDDPQGYLAALGAIGDARELTNPADLGAFGWLAQAVGVSLPATLTAGTPKRHRSR